MTEPAGSKLNVLLVMGKNFGPNPMIYNDKITVMLLMIYCLAIFSDYELIKTINDEIPQKDSCPSTFVAHCIATTGALCTGAPYKAKCAARCSETPDWLRSHRWCFISTVASVGTVELAWCSSLLPADVLENIDLAIQLDLYNQTIAHIARFHLMSKRVYDFHFYDQTVDMCVKFPELKPRRYGTTTTVRRTIIVRAEDSQYQEQNAIIVGGEWKAIQATTETCMCSGLANDSRRIRDSQVRGDMIGKIDAKGTQFRPPATPMTDTDFSKNKDFVTFRGMLAYKREIRAFEVTINDCITHGDEMSQLLLANGNDTEMNSRH
ncbi:hypothetical protein G5I_02937 [Acromyrmex echinatior]|uniref:Uncharacterized protein n=1 Tax=Acromyrmex echinatior TaxID=103372 RepID=F4WBL8_ACREC|nr:hypothetical protein G5I_02937 [Acromyrmex echinatior]